MTGPYSTTAGSNLPARERLARRLIAYQRERFPLAAYVPLIAIAAFAALAFSRVARGVAGFVPAGPYLVCAVTLLAAFFLLRVADEHKDAATDRANRPELPVPRGLIELAELRQVGAAALVLVVAANALLDPVLLLPLALAGVWMALMTREFFAPAWLRSRPTIYLVSHMVVMPLLLLYATSLDWLHAGAGLPAAVWLFLIATFASGLVLEIGRKVRAPFEEREGVETYSSSWGERRAALIWVAVTLGAGALVAAAGARAGGRWTPILAPVAALLVASVALPILRGAVTRTGKRLETAGGLWNLGAYLLLALPWLERWFAGR